MKKELIIETSKGEFLYRMNFEGEILTNEYVTKLLKKIISNSIGNPLLIGKKIVRHYNLPEGTKINSSLSAGKSNEECYACLLYSSGLPDDLVVKLKFKLRDKKQTNLNKELSEFIKNGK